MLRERNYTEKKGEGKNAIRGTREKEKGNMFLRALNVVRSVKRKITKRINEVKRKKE